MQNLKLLHCAEKLGVIVSPPPSLVANLSERLQRKINDSFLEGEALIISLGCLALYGLFLGSSGARLSLWWKKENKAEWEASCVMCIAEIEGRKCGILCRFLALELGR
ncbi:uncharacterized protein LOC133717567 isoform X1 [Rosa rugosa]|uniref:uncharacterized protein LOC133717567 isoform X1 n=1 Tax=Rosa rugosa TaxID=74645 RepID=UPI002B41142D|nr:uncharacterized protein LOC133717567 isoform X1 [Rosa rugosa]